jgi:hypothetical protein
VQPLSVLVPGSPVQPRGPLVGAGVGGQRPVQIGPGVLAGNRVSLHASPLSGTAWIRTRDARIFNPPLYRLSYHARSITRFQALGWIRTIDHFLTKEVRYHCATRAYGAVSVARGC